MNWYKAVCEIYQELFRQCTLKSNYEYNPNLRDEALINKFVKWWDNTYGDRSSVHSLIRYFEFQFSRYEGISTRFGKNMILINWLIGQKAIKEWDSRDTRKGSYTRYKLNREVGLKLLKAFSEQESAEAKQNFSDLYLSGMEFEDVHKNRFYNKVEGLIYCADMTSMHNEKSKLCRGCSNSGDCIKKQKVILPRIYKIRNEER